MTDDGDDWEERFIENDYEDTDGCDEDEECPTCDGRGTVNPLTAPKDMFCIGTTECPDCDGTGVMQ